MFTWTNNTRHEDHWAIGSQSIELLEKNTKHLIEENGAAMNTYLSTMAAAAAAASLGVAAQSKP